MLCIESDKSNPSLHSDDLSGNYDSSLHMIILKLSGHAPTLTRLGEHLISPLKSVANGNNVETPGTPLPVDAAWGRHLQAVSVGRREFHGICLKLAQFVPEIVD